MSNAFEPTNPTDNCAYCGRVRASDWHRVTSNPGTHAFVEPAPQSAPSADEAKVREILDRTGWFFEVPRDKAQLVGHDEVLGLLREAYAAGKADGARCPNCDHSDVSHGDRGCKRVVLSITTRPQWCPCYLSQTKVLDAIARRGSEG